MFLFAVMFAVMFLYALVFLNMLFGSVFCCCVSWFAVLLLNVLPYFWLVVCLDCNCGLIFWLTKLINTQAQAWKTSIWDFSMRSSSLCHIHSHTWTSVPGHWKQWCIHIRYCTDEHHHALKLNFNRVNVSFGPRCGALNIQTCSAPQSSEINFNVTTLILASWLLNWFNYRILLADIDQPSLKGGVYPCNWLWCISSRRGAQRCGQTRNSVITFKGQDWIGTQIGGTPRPQMWPLRWWMMTKLNTVHSLLVLFDMFSLHTIRIY